MMILGMIAKPIAAGGGGSVSTSAFTDLGDSYSSNSWTLPAMAGLSGNTTLLFVAGFGTTGAPTATTPASWTQAYHAVDGSSEEMVMACYYRSGVFASYTPVIAWDMVAEGLVMSVTLTGATAITAYGPQVQTGFGVFQRTLQTVVGVPAGSARLDHLLMVFNRTATFAATVAQQATQHRYNSGPTVGMGHAACVKLHPTLGDSTGNQITQADPDLGSPNCPSNGYTIIATP